MSEYEGKYPKDYTGENILPGTIVVYPVRRGSSMNLRSARVTSVRPTTHGWVIEGTIDTGKRVLLKHPSRIIVINKG